LASCNRGGAVWIRREDAVKICGEKEEEREMRVAKAAVNKAVVAARGRVNLKEE